MRGNRGIDFAGELEISRFPDGKSTAPGRPANACAQGARPGPRPDPEDWLLPALYLQDLGDCQLPKQGKAVGLKSADEPPPGTVTRTNCLGH